MPDAQACVFGALIVLPEKAHTQFPDTHECGIVPMDARITRLILFRQVPSEPFLLSRIANIQTSHLPDRQRKKYRKIAIVVGNVERHRRSGISRDFERCTIGEDTFCRCDRELSDSKLIAVQGQLSESPAVVLQSRGTSLDVRLEVSFLLLKVLRPKKQAL
jgi:hypothetical protein